MSRRVAGILLHPTSLPGPGRVGRLGPRAAQFVDELAEASIGLWQVLPLGPTGFGDSPYQSFSAFAGNPLLVAPESLVEDGLLDTADLSEPGSLGLDPPALGATRRRRSDLLTHSAAVDFGAAIAESTRFLDLAFQRFESGKSPDLASELDDFRETNRDWLEDYALFAAIHDATGRAWVSWPAPLARRDPDALEHARAEHARAIRRHELVQFLFFRQWDALRERARGLGIETFGDLPFYTAHDSADVWAHRDLFDLDESGAPCLLAGAPPDDFNDRGQLWGNPVYRWDRLEETGFDWWVRRVGAALRVFDRVRLDHFLAFDAFWGVPTGSESAASGSWIPVPGEALFRALNEKLGSPVLVAEDLGMVSDAVRALRDRFDFPRMLIQQFGFGGDPKVHPFAPHNHVRNAVVYTGTHDNETMQGWFREGFHGPGRRAAEVEEEKRRILAVTGGDGSAIHRDFTRIVMMSVADTAVIPMQDVLGLGNEARMNRPGEPSGNWTWRMREEDWSPEVRERLATLVGATGRAPDPLD